MRDTLKKVFHEIRKKDILKSNQLNNLYTMSKIKVSESSTGGFELMEAGTYVARCYRMIHIGTNRENILGKEKDLNKVRLYWELPTEMHVFKEEDGEQPRVISKEFTLSLNEKANLRKFLESWRGKSFTAKELEEFDISALIGAQCQLNIIHKEAKNGNTYLEISSVSKVMKGVKVPDQINESFVFGYDPFEPEKLEGLPEFIVDKIKSSNEYKAATEGATHVAPPVEEEGDEDDPF